MPLSGDKLSAIFQRDRRLIMQWQARGTIPKNAETAEEALLGAVNWFAALRGGRLAMSGEDGEVLDLTAERARLARAQAEKTELENAERRAELIPQGQLEEALCSLASATVMRLDAIPVKAAPMCGAASNDAEREQILRRLLDDALNSLAAYLARGNGGGDGGSGSGSPPAAAANG